MTAPAPDPEVVLDALETRYGWVTIGEALDLWSDAPGEVEDNYEPLPLYLRAAVEDLTQYAPRVPVWEDVATVPATVKLAQVLMARHLYARANAGNATGYGTEDWQMSTYPLVLEAKDKMKRWRNPFRGLR